MRSQLVGVVGGVGVAAAVAVSLGVTTPGQATPPGNNGRIAFVSFRDGNDEIYAMNLDGGNQERLTNNSAPDYDPGWLFGGGQLYFTSQKTGSERIWLKDALLTAPESQVAPLGLTAQLSAPASSATGVLAFETTLHGGYEIYTVGTDGQTRRLTTNDPISDRAPDWSPDGTRIVFWSARNGNRDIYVMNADGSNQRQLTSFLESDRDPSWSPDGTKIAFERRVAPFNGDILTISPTGGASQAGVNLTNHPANDRQPVWSPDGTKIAFVSDRGGNDDIWVMNADGSSPVRLTTHPAGDVQPDWSTAERDSDGDGLLDDWELNGYDADGDRKIDVDLKKMGADPNHKDIFVEIDKMIGHHVYPEAMAKVVAAFARAPVPNRDGKTGITLHVDNGSGSIMDSKSGARWGGLSKSNPLPHRDVLGSYSSGDNYNWSAVDAIKKQHFVKERQPIFHYVVFGHRYGKASEGSGGLSRGFGASDFIVTLGAFCPAGTDCAGSIDEQAAIFMHELGHNLGLKHGGGDHVNWKPNYLSLMNYTFNLSGLMNETGAGILDYSRASPYSVSDSNKIGTLFERSLDERVGLEPLGAWLSPLHTVFWCPPVAGQPPVRRTLSVRFAPIDWNCDAKIDPAVAADVNGDKTAGQTLTSFNDWANLQFKGGMIGAQGASRPLPQTTPGGDEPPAELREAARVILRDARAPTIAIAGPRQARAPKQLKLTIVARDDKGLALLVGMLNKKSYSFPAKRATKVLGAIATIVRPGTATIRAAAVDNAGNRSKTVVVKVRILRRS